MTTKEAIDSLRLLKAEVEWDYSLEYQIAIDKILQSMNEYTTFQSQILATSEKAYEKPTFKPGDKVYACCYNRLPHNTMIPHPLTIISVTNTIYGGFVYTAKIIDDHFFTFTEDEVGEKIFVSKEAAEAQIEKVRAKRQRALEDAYVEAAVKNPEERFVVEPDNFEPLLKMLGAEKITIGHASLESAVNYLTQLFYRTGCQLPAT